MYFSGIWQHIELIFLLCILISIHFNKLVILLNVLWALFCALTINYCYKVNTLFNIIVVISEFFETASHYIARLPLNWRSSCLSFPSTETASMYHYFMTLLFYILQLYVLSSTPPIFLSYC
jgi:hypothetical protein